MKRWSAFVVVMVAVGSVAFVAGASNSPERVKPAEEKKSDGTKATVITIHKTAVFNMAAVMRDFDQAKYRVWALNNKKTEMSKKLGVWRAEYMQIQQELNKNPNDPKKEEKAKRMLALARMIEDEDREINKTLNDDASAIIGGLYDKMKLVVDKVAEENGFQLVLAYPDAVTAEERNSPYIKELKLKPPAAQPFHVAKEIDITGRVVERLNELYPALDPETGKPVDVSRLDLPGGPPNANPKGGSPVPLPPIPNASGTAPTPEPPPAPLPRIPSPKDGPQPAP